MRDQVFILGSCATRDAFDFVKHPYSITGYVARTSLASGFAPSPFEITPSELNHGWELSSPFQRRMVEIDLTKGLAQYLTDLNPRCSLVVVDLIDERFNLLVSKGTLATFSIELQRLEPIKRFPDISIVKTNTEQHFDLWKQGLRKFASYIQSQQLLVVLNKLSWAEMDIQGSKFSRSDVQTHNTYLNRMYEAFQDTLACEVIEYDRRPLADCDHKWGKAPFHYEQGVYHHFMAQLDKIVGHVDT